MTYPSVLQPHCSAKDTSISPQHLKSYSSANQNISKLKHYWALWCAKVSSRLLMKTNGTLCAMQSRFQDLSHPRPTGIPPIYELGREHGDVARLVQTRTCHTGLLNPTLPRTSLENSFQPLHSSLALCKPQTRNTSINKQEVNRLNSHRLHRPDWNFHSSYQVHTSTH